MEKLKRVWHYLISEPSRWLLYCFFQPAKFRSDFAGKKLPERIISVLRCCLLIFFYAYPTALIIRIFIYMLRPDLYPAYEIHSILPLSAPLEWFFFDAAWAAALSCLVGAVVSSLFSMRMGISFALALSLANGIIVNTGDDTLVGIIFGVAFGVALGIAFNSAHILKEGSLQNVTTASSLGILAGLVIGYLTGTIGGYWAGFMLGVIDPTLHARFAISGSLGGVTVGGLSACFFTWILGSLLKTGIKSHEQVVSMGIKITAAVAAAFGIAIGIPVGDVGITGGTFMEGIITGIRQEGIVGAGFLCLYLISYYRLPLYPLSAYSTMRAYLASKRQPQQALYCLRHSSLYWDECVFLPLPYLKRILLLSSKENLPGTLDEIQFIVHERPQQNWAAQEVAYELALHDLEKRTSLHDIGPAHQQLALLLPYEVRSLNVHAKKVFRYLDDASRAAASYDVQINKQDRYKALEQMISSLQQIHPDKALRTVDLNRRLDKVVNQWHILARQARETLQSVSGRLYINNPYAPGNPLELGDPLFVGRNDIVQKLGQALQQRSRPTFLLTGERRMGKSSIIKQLPVLLGPRYLPVFFDLQRPGMIASSAAFFATLAAGIEKQLKERSLPVQKLERSVLDHAQQQDEFKVYDIFEQWLVDIEQTLEEVNCVLILIFDEFEKLEDAEKRGTISLDLLFDWFRSVIQNRAHLALLFSGAKLVGDMGRSWAGYFINVERIKVSFLPESDAHDLIVRPAPRIFQEQSAREIMRMTHCHPFLIQAMCKHIIENLNDSSRAQATLYDVSISAKKLFESWAVYFWDLWDRCDPDQRACLLALLTLKNADANQIAQTSGINLHQVQHALSKLQMRDLAICEEDSYQIAIPIFAQWIEHNRHFFTTDSPAVKNV